MIPGLKAGQEKMSKSDPDSAIFMEDTAADVKRKIKKAFCEENLVCDGLNVRCAVDESAVQIKNNIHALVLPLSGSVFATTVADCRIPVY